MLSRSQRIAGLLADLDNAEKALERATTAAEAADARSDIHSLRHSLWLAGYEFSDADQEDAA